MSSKSLLKDTGISSPPPLQSPLKSPYYTSSLSPHLSPRSRSPRSPRSPHRRMRPRSILKRPPPLQLSRSLNAFAPNIIVVVSPVSGIEAGKKTVNLTATSPHVHFPPSAKLTSTFSAHSPNSYDRGAIIVSPNPLEIPSWGSRIYSPSSGTFRESGSEGSHWSDEENEEERLSGTLALEKVEITTPTLSPSETLDTPSPRRMPFSPIHNGTRASLRFQSLNLDPLPSPLNAQSVHQPVDLDKALKAYPRSPYPTAPSSPVSKLLDSDEDAMEVHGEAETGTRLGIDVAKAPANVTRAHTISGVPTLARKRVNGPIPPPLPLVNFAFPPFGNSEDAAQTATPSRTAASTAGLTEYDTTPSQYSADSGETDMDVVSESQAIRNAFWDSLSLEDSGISTIEVISGTVPPPIESIPDMDVPASVSDDEDAVIGDPSCNIFGTSDGQLCSPEFSDMVTRNTMPIQALPRRTTLTPSESEWLSWKSSFSASTRPTWSPISTSHEQSSSK